MTYKILRSQKQKPKDLNSEIALVGKDNRLERPSPNPRFTSRTVQVPARLLHNSTDMELLNLYAKGELKWPDTGKTCENCISYYPDALAKYGGRCKAHAYAQTHKDTPAEDRAKGWTHPIDKVYFPFWPGCPDYVRKERVSRR